MGRWFLVGVVFFICVEESVEFFNEKVKKFNESLKRYSKIININVVE